MKTVLLMRSMFSWTRCLVPFCTIVIFIVHLFAKLIQAVDLVEDIHLCDIFVIAETPVEGCFNAQLW